jgi:glycosyltransferase involved in cell wall biosynthesis
MKIAIFDYVTTPNNAIGMCHRRMMKSLDKDHEFTLFSCAFDNPSPSKIRWIRIAAPKRPLALLFVAYHFVASMHYAFQVAWRRKADQWVLGVESNFLFADVIHAQFCHLWFLKKHWQQCRLRGLRGAFRWLDHVLHAVMEPIAFRRAKTIVVASQGLARELTALYPCTTGKIVVVSNPVDSAAMQRPPDFDRVEFRRQVGATESDLLLSFVALGQYERKGLPALLEALRRESDLPFRLVVVGGQPDTIRDYKQRVACMGLESRVVFCGMQKDVRPFLWASDAFVLPSFYEVFPFVVLEAAAAGCLLVVSHLNGVEEFLEDGRNGMQVTTDATGIAEGLRKLAAMSTTEREAIALAGTERVRAYSSENFIEGWRRVFEKLVPGERTGC